MFSTRTGVCVARHLRRTTATPVWYGRSTTRPSFVASNGLHTHGAAAAAVKTGKSMKREVEVFAAEAAWEDEIGTLAVPIPPPPKQRPPHLDAPTHKGGSEATSTKGKGKWNQAKAAEVGMDDADNIPAAELEEAFETATAEERASRAEQEGLLPLESGSLDASDVPIANVKPPRNAPVARLERNLKRVLFSPGVHHLRDSRTGVWNFDSDLAKIPTPDEFAAHRLPAYITASLDEELASLAKENSLRFVGSTSTLTQSLSQIYFTLSGMRGVDTSVLSHEFAETPNDYTAGAQLPAALQVSYLPNGTYAIDNDKQHSIEENILSDYGRILEKMVTTDRKDFKRFLNSSPETAVPEKERTEREAYSYCKGNTILMRSQLDCQDDRLPGNGTFDIKTRACWPIRQDRANWKNNSAYHIYKSMGYTESFEREYYDLTRSGMLKFSLQARIGQMDGIFVAYHNTRRFFGFQYLPLGELDERLFGSTEMANQAFRLSVGIMERILEHATGLFPEQSIGLTIRRLRSDKETNEHHLVATVQPIYDNPATPRPVRAILLTVKNELNGEPAPFNIDFSPDPKERENQKWSVKYSFAITSDDPKGVTQAVKYRNDAIKAIRIMNQLYVPDGMTPGAMIRQDTQKRKALATKADEGNQDEATSEEATENEKAPVDGEAAQATTSVLHPRTPRIRWVLPNERIRKLREDARQSGIAYWKTVRSWRKAPAVQTWWQDEGDLPRIEASIKEAGVKEKTTAKAQITLKKNKPRKAVPKEWAEWKAPGKEGSVGKPVPTKQVDADGQKWGLEDGPQGDAAQAEGAREKDS